MANEDISNELKKLKADIADLRSDVASLVKTLKDAGVEQGQEAYDRAYERARQTGEAVRARAEDVYETFGKEVEERPLTSVLTAFGVGFVVGMLLDHRHR
ncbi:MAG: hypothetical protein AMJ55_02890 [Gammaproteobacteria bacterium SG8_15]|nr:MAG: hypothetical protein AMJ55_02890 [Gammaproteobacteria bacterium SG8_15]